MKRIFSALLMLATLSSSAQFVQLNCNDFTINGNPFKPLVVNYTISFAIDDNGAYFISPDLASSTCAGGPIGNVYGYGAGNMNYLKSRSKLHGDLTRIKNAGFNTIRLIGAGSIMDASDNFAIPVPASGGGYTTYYNLLSQFFQDCHSAGLKVIMLLAGKDQWKASDQYKTYISGFASRFKDSTTIFAYDIYNEPENELKVAKLEFRKYDYTKLVSDWAWAAKKNDPNHLLTIGLYAPDFSAFDPEMLPIDFVSLHIYSQYDNINTSLDRLKTWYYWCGKTITMPWIIGETGYSGTNGPDAANFPEVGTESDQKTFVDNTMQMSLDCGSKAYGYWNFQEYQWCKVGIDPNCNPHEHHFGLYYKFGEGATNWYGLGAYFGDPMMYTLDSLAMTPKPALGSFANYTSLVKGSCTQPSDYYTVLNGPLSSDTNFLAGRVIDQNSVGMANVCVSGATCWSTCGVWRTFTDANGYFTLRSGTDNGYDGLTDVTISYPGYSQLYYSNVAPPWMGYPSGHIFTLYKVNDKGWVREWNNGDAGKFADQWNLSATTKFYKGDFNGDGLDDMLCIGQGPGEYLADDCGSDPMIMVTYKNPLTTNPYSAGWQKTGRACNGSNLYSHRAGQFTVGDFDHDGRDDLLVKDGNWLGFYTWDETNWNWNLIDDNNNQINQTGNDMSAMAPYTYFVAGNFDGAGVGVLAVDRSNGWITWFRRDNTGTWQWLQSNNGFTNNANYKLSYLTPYNEQLLAGDFDGDGKDEVLGNKLTAGGFQLFKYNTANTWWWTPAYWKDVTNNSGMWAYRQNIVIGNFDSDAADEILGINSSFRVKFKFASVNSLYWDSSYEPLIADWTVSPGANKYLFLKTDMNLPEQLFIQRGNSAGLFSWNMNGWQCSAQRYAAPGFNPSPEQQPVSSTDEMVLFPNPASDEINIRLTADRPGQDMTLRVTSIVGQEMMRVKVPAEKTASDIRLDLSALEPGIYFVTLFNGEKRMMTKKVAVQR